VTCPKSLYFGKTRQEIDIIKANKNWKSIQQGTSVGARCFFFQPIANGSTLDAFGVAKVTDTNPLPVFDMQSNILKSIVADGL
jgi:hypothetical protein